jgi:hypothetical protein
VRIDAPARDADHWSAFQRIPAESANRNDML